jgi:DNA-binding transcriptional MerR regulator
LKSENKIRDAALNSYKNDAFDNGFYQYFKERKGSHISKILNSTERKITFKDITYKMLNDWERAGLIDNKREGNEWRRFSIIDAVWLKIIKELRSFGMSLKQIKIAKTSLEFQQNKCGVAMPLLEFYTAFAIGNKMPVLILVFNDGVSIPANYTQYKVTRDFLGLENHIQLSLNNIIQGFFPEVDLKEIIKTEIPIELDEMELLAFIRVGEYEKVEIKLDKNKIKLIEGTKREIGEKVFEVLKSKNYEEIIVRKDKEGNITSLIRKKKLKIE